MICDRCGGQFRYSEMAEESTGLWVCKRGCWEPEHPQDFVTGVTDDVSVSVARPTIPQTMGETTLSVAATENDTVIKLTSTDGLVEGDPIGIVLDNGAAHWTFISDLPTGSGTLTFQGEVVTFGGDADVTLGGVTDVFVTLGSYIMGDAAAGNVVYTPSINSESWT